MANLKKEFQQIRQRVEVLQAQSKEHKGLKDKVDAVLKKQQCLLADYLQKQRILHQQQYFKKHPELLAFYRRVQLKLSELFLACKVINSGLSARQEDATDTKLNMVGKATNVAKHVMKLGHDSLSFVPGVGFIKAIVDGGLTGVDVGAKIAKKVHDKKEDVIINNISSLTANLTAMDTLIENVARRLTLRYEQQIRCLTMATEKKALGKMLAKIKVSDDTKDGGAEKLAACAIGRMLDAMRSGEINFNRHNSLAEQLVDVVFYSNLKQKALFTKTKIPTKKETNLKKWRGEGIFQKAGIKTEDDKYYKGNEKQKKCSRLEKYGYRLGTEQEAQELKLELQQKPDKTLVDKIIPNVYQQPKEIELMALSSNKNGFFSGNKQSVDHTTHHQIEQTETKHHYIKM